MRILELNTILPYEKYKGKTVEEVIQFNFNYILWLIKNREEIYLHDNTLDFLIQWSRGLGTGKTYIDSKEEKELKNIIARRWADYEMEIDRGNSISNSWNTNREIDRDNEQVYEP